jgi:hypothetical protein
VQWLFIFKSKIKIINNNTKEMIKENALGTLKEITTIPRNKNISNICFKIQNTKSLNKKIRNKVEYLPNPIPCAPPVIIATCP